MRNETLVATRLNRAHIRCPHLSIPLLAAGPSLAPPGPPTPAQAVRHALTSVEQNIDVGNPRRARPWRRIIWR